MGYRIDPRKQFSKKLARWTAIFWFVFMSWSSAILVIAPEAAQYAVYMAIISTVVMVLNVYSYCKNSIAEKMIFGILDKTKLELSMGNSKVSFGEESENDNKEEGFKNGKGDDDDEEESGMTEGESNG